MKPVVFETYNGFIIAYNDYENGYDVINPKTSSVIKTIGNLEFARFYVDNVLMKNKIKPVKCGNCKYFQHDNSYIGYCSKDNEVVKDFNVCNKLPTDNERREAKIKKYYRG